MNHEINPKILKKPQLTEHIKLKYIVNLDYEQHLKKQNVAENYFILLDYILCVYNI